MANRVSQTPDFLGYFGKRAIVTGGSSGIGRATAVTLAAHGAVVVIVGRRDDALAETIEISKESAGSGAMMTSIVADLIDEAAPDSILTESLSRLGGLDLLVNAAACLHRENVNGETTSETVWNELMQINLRAPYLLAKGAIPALKENQGSIVNISSIWAQIGAKKQVAYSTSKAAMVEMTRSLALDHAKDRIRVNCVCPGTTRTPLIYRGRVSFDEAANAAVHPLGRIGEPQDIANAVLFLGSNNAAGWITGEALIIDGGFAIQ